jgi:outer membrane receptor protein involved in Fe transport
MAVDRQNYFVNPRWTSIVNDSTVFEARGSFSIFKLLAANPNNDGSTAYRDLFTQKYFGGDQHAAGDNRRNRHQFKADLSHFRENMGGTHNFKMGFEWQVTPLREEKYYQGARGPDSLAGCTEACISETPDTAHLLFDGEPFQVELYQAPMVLNYNTRKWNAYFQDQWVVGDRLTLNLGVRIDHATGNLKETPMGGGSWAPLVVLPERDGVLSLTSAAPRFGLVWDVMGDRKTTIKGSAGRFYNQIGAIYPQVAMPNITGSLGFRRYDWNDLNGDLVYQPGEEGVLRFDGWVDPAQLPTIDPDLKHQYTDVFTVGFEREITQDWGFTVTGIFKRDRDMFGIVNNAVPFSSYNRITVTNPLDNQPLEIFTLRPEFLGLPGQTVLTNPGERPGDTEKLERKYDGVEFVLRKRMMDGWLMQASYVYGNPEGNVSNQFGNSQFADYRNPNSLVNGYGALPWSSKHQFKFHGAFQAPYGLLVSGFLEVLGGNPWTDNFGFTGIALKGAATVRFFQEDFPQILSEQFIEVGGEDPGSRRLDTQTRVDMRVEKRFQIAGTHGISLSADIFNLFNASTVIRIQSLRYDNANFGKAAEIVNARQVRLAVKWDF